MDEIAMVPGTYSVVEALSVSRTECITDSVSKKNLLIPLLLLFGANVLRKGWL